MASPSPQRRDSSAQSSHRQDEITIIFSEINCLDSSRSTVTFTVECLCFHSQECECSLGPCLCPAAPLRQQRHPVTLATRGLLQDPILNALSTFQLGGQDLLLRLRTIDTSERFLMTYVSLPNPFSPNFTEDSYSGIVGSLLSTPLTVPSLCRLTHSLF